jgi:hypothetical protein
VVLVAHHLQPCLELLLVKARRPLQLEILRVGLKLEVLRLVEPALLVEAVAPQERLVQPLHAGEEAQVLAVHRQGREVDRRHRRDVLQGRKEVEGQAVAQAGVVVGVLVEEQILVALPTHPLAQVDAEGLELSLARGLAAGLHHRVGGGTLGGGDALPRHEDAQLGREGVPGVVVLQQVLEAAVPGLRCALGDQGRHAELRLGQLAKLRLR